MVESDTAGIDFVEVFPTSPGAAPALTAYEALVGGEEAYLVGGKLAYRLGKQFPGHWVWTNGRIVTDQPQEENTIRDVIEALWREQPEIYKDLRQVRRGTCWRPREVGVVGRPQLRIEHRDRADRPRHGPEEVPT